MDNIKLFVSFCVKGNESEILFWLFERNCLQIVIVLSLLAYHTLRGKQVWGGHSWPSMTAHQPHFLSLKLVVCISSSGNSYTISM
jgi:hypothetical protein